MRLGETERWIVRNFSGELHVFHLHQTEFLVDRFSGTPDQTLGLGMRDVINLPYAKGGRPGVVELIIPFTNPVIVGEFVYHCHIVGHEDAGMMANISVLPKKTLAQDLWDRFTRLAGLECRPSGRRPRRRGPGRRCWPSSTPTSVARGRAERALRVRGPTWPEAGELALHVVVVWRGAGDYMGCGRGAADGQDFLELERDHVARSRALHKDGGAPMEAFRGLVKAAGTDGALGHKERS